MSLSGPDALRSLDEALRDIRREEDEIAKRLARSAELVTKIRATEGELFRQLAKVRLDPAMQSELAGRLSEAEVRARDSSSSTAARPAPPRQSSRRSTQRLAELGGERARKLAEIEKRQAELKALADTARGEAASAIRPSQKAAAHARELEHVAEESLRQDYGRPRPTARRRASPTATIRCSCTSGSAATAPRPTRPAISSPGSTASSRGMVGFHKARPNFAMLDEIPLRLREHAERQEANAEAARRELAALETAAIDAAGGKPVREALEAAQAADRGDRRGSGRRRGRARRGGQGAARAGAGQRSEILGGHRRARRGARPRGPQGPPRGGADDAHRRRTTRSSSRSTTPASARPRKRARPRTRSSGSRCSPTAGASSRTSSSSSRSQRFDDPRSSFREDNLVGDLLTDFLRGGITRRELLGPLAAEPELGRRQSARTLGSIAACNDDDDSRRIDERAPAARRGAARRRLPLARHQHRRQHAVEQGRQFWRQLGPVPRHRVEQPRRLFAPAAAASAPAVASRPAASRPGGGF